jgi:hypothetical protein
MTDQMRYRIKKAQDEGWRFEELIWKSDIEVRSPIGVSMLVEKTECGLDRAGVPKYEQMELFEV